MPNIVNSVLGVPATLSSISKMLSAITIHCILEEVTVVSVFRSSPPFFFAFPLFLAKIFYVSLIFPFHAIALFQQEPLIVCSWYITLKFDLCNFSVFFAAGR